MTMTANRSKPALTVASPDQRWLMRVSQVADQAYAVSALNVPDPVTELTLACTAAPSCAVLALSPRDSAIDVRGLLDRSPGARFVFVADSLPLRRAVARVIREHGHAVVSNGESALVIAATVAALMAGSGERLERSS